MICYICLKDIVSSKGLVYHYKYDHGLKDDDKYICTFSSCLRSFYLVNSFRKHLKVHATTEASKFLDNTEIPLGKNDNSSVLENTKTENVTECFSQSLSGSNSVANDSFEDLISSLKDKEECHNLNVELFVSSLYNNPLIPRKTVQFIVEKVNSLFCNSNSLLMELKEFLVRFLLKSGQNENTDLQIINSIFQTIGNSFSAFLTEHRSFSHFASQGNLILPNKFVIGQRLVSKTQNGNVLMETQNVYEVVVSLKDVFRVLFEIPGFFDVMKKHQKNLLTQRKVLTNFIQGNYWQSKLNEFEGKTVFPIFLYFDEYETGNALGSHSGVNKLGAVYISLASMPTECLSKVRNIFLFALFYSKDRVLYGNRAIFQQLIEQLTFLEQQGITVNIGNQEQVIYFKLGLILGDNLGLHSILGLVESFSATCRCRFCKMTKQETTTS